MALRHGLLILVVPCLLCGCTHFRETRAITAFTEAMTAGDMDELRATTSMDFKQKALRRAEALDDLQVLRLPDEPPEVVEVEDVSESEKRVTVKSPNGNSRLLYKLVREPNTGSWVVDDVFTRQLKSGVQVSKAITEQMDLLLTIRDFLDVWAEADRDAVLAVTTESFRASLDALPAPWLARVTRQVADNQHDKSSRQHKPQVSIDGSTAVVRLPRTDGALQLSMELEDGNWKVDDAAIQTRRDEQAIRSVKNRALIIAAGTNFVDAFRRRDRNAVRELSSDDFYKNVLRDADLAAASIPDIALAPSDYELNATVDHATLLIPTPESVVKVELERDAEDVADAEVAYRVQDIGLYEADGKARVRLSAFFTAAKRVHEFHRALRRSDLTDLRQLASTDFNSRVWSRASGLPLQLLPLSSAGSPMIETESTTFRGSVTRVTAKHEAGEVTYVLRGTGGKLAVDDILVGVRGVQQSLKQSLELSLPILSFAGAIQSSQLPDLQRVSSADFNRLVWDGATAVPDMGPAAMKYLTKPVRSIKTQPGRALVELGTHQSGAVISLLRENEHWVVDDIELVAGIEPANAVPLKQTLRQQIASGDVAHTTTAIAMAETGAPPARRERKRFNLQQPPSRTEKPSVVMPASATEQQSSVVDHATMFEDRSSTTQPRAAAPRHAHRPGVLDIARNTEPLPAADTKADTVDLNELFRDIDENAPAKASSAMTPTTILTSDAGRVTDPSMQPIEIPQ